MPNYSEEEKFKKQSSESSDCSESSDHSVLLFVTDTLSMAQGFLVSNRVSDTNGRQLILKSSLLPLFRRGRIVFPLFGKEGLGEIRPAHCGTQRPPKFYLWEGMECSATLSGYVRKSLGDNSSFSAVFKISHTHNRPLFLL
jgi:hypothetical protein